MPAKKRTLKAVDGEDKTEVKRRSLGAVARAAALKQLVESYPERWEELLRAEREKVGLPAVGRKVSRVEKLVARMREAGVSEEELQQALVDAGFKK